MSVTDLLKHGAVRDLLDPLLPSIPVKLDVPLKVPPGSKNYSLVGTAFDYALRFELQRRSPDITTRRWLAESSLQLLDLRARALKARSGSADQIAHATGDFSKAQKIVERAKACISTYIQDPNPSAKSRTDMVAHAIRLARLDVVYRAGLIDREFSVAHRDDVQNILQLLKIAPYKALGSDGALHLNPTFGRFSEMVGGADADVISGGVLIDFKAVLDASLRKSYRRQLLSYVILALAARSEDATFPKVESIGVYFARHAHLWTMPVATFTKKSSFADVSADYLDYAATVYSGANKKTLSNLVSRIRKVG